MSKMVLFRSIRYTYPWATAEIFVWSGQAPPPPPKKKTHGEKGLHKEKIVSPHGYPFSFSRGGGKRLLLTICGADSFKSPKCDC